MGEEVGGASLGISEPLPQVNYMLLLLHTLGRIMDGVRSGTAGGVLLDHPVGRVVAIHAFNI